MKKKLDFSEIELKKNLQKAIGDLGYKTPTPVQKEAIPFLIKSNDDLIALAQTGTGKTAAFGLPIIQKINISIKTTQSIILCPTRELCLQITKDLNSFAKYYTKVNITPVYGGANIQTQIKQLKIGSQIIVGTPGRVIDLIKRKKLNLEKIKILTLDEADEMLNMGFKEDLDFILSKTPHNKQTLLFSATMPKDILSITKEFMHNAKKIEVAKRNEGAKNVEHNLFLVQNKDRYKLIRRICDLNPEIYCIIFCRTRRETNEISEKLMQDGYNADCLNGDLSQAQRDLVMNKFRKKNIKILVATDVAARGIDINNLSHVINYKLPDDNEVYIHRSGRTGRAGKKGVSIIISNSREKKKLSSIQKMLKKDIITKSLPSGEEICEKQLMFLAQKISNVEINKNTDKFISPILKVLSEIDKETLIKKFISIEFNKILSFYNSNADLSKEKRKKSSNNQFKNKLNINKIGIAEDGFSRFFINIGKQQKIETHNLIGLINDNTKNKKIQIGKIDIMRKFSFFEVEKNYEKKVINSFKNIKYKGINLIVELSNPPSELKSIKKNKDLTKKKSSFKKRYKQKNKRKIN